MQLVNVLLQESPRTLRNIFLLTAISGAANAALVGFINNGADAVSRGEDTTWSFAMFIACLLLFAVAKVRAETAGKVLFDDAMTRQRERLMDKLLVLRLDAFEQMRGSDIISTSARSIGQVVQASDTIVYGLQSMFMLFFCAAYLAYISFPAFLVVTGAFVFVAIFRQLQQSENKKQMEAFSENDKELSNLVAESLAGFKEIKINIKRRKALRAHYARLIDLSSMLSLRATKEIVRVRLIIQSVFYLVIAMVVFVIPKITDVYALEVLEITAIVLFLVGYLAGFLDIFPMISRTNNALYELEELEKQLDANEEISPLNPVDDSIFEVLELRNVQFSYFDPDESRGFQLGPINMRVNKGEVIYVVGGNGSGKSTLIKVLTGLYPLAAGELLLNGKPIGNSELTALRQNFSLITSDFHLFGRLYGYENVEPAFVAKLIDKMQLNDKVSFADGAFSTKALSTGQKKRLAMITALVEDNAIYVFDEWAAEQDPYFRSVFYTEIVPELRAKGKTVIAITHDDFYFDHADNVIQLDYGKISE